MLWSDERDRTNEAGESESFIIPQMLRPNTYEKVRKPHHRGAWMTGT